MEAIAYDERGLVPCVIQDARTGEVLTLAYMNAEALAEDQGDRRAAPLEPLARRALAQGRDLGQHPGRARAALRLRRATPCSRSSTRPGPPATPASARASTTATSTLTEQEALPALERTIAERAAAGDAEGSYTAKLLADPAFTGEKVQEEAEEVVRAAREESDERVAEEAADVLYHLTVLLRTRGLELADAERVLLARRR